jgi:hypothetical protein
MSESKSNTYLAPILRGRPAFSTDQRARILNLLRQAGAKGVRREDLLYVHRWSQAGARIHELERMGYVIEHVLEPGERFVTYRLISEPACEKPLPNFERKQEPPQAAFSESSGDWYPQKTGCGRPHPFSDLPLFRNSEQR